MMFVRCTFCVLFSCLLLKDLISFRLGSPFKARSDLRVFAGDDNDKTSNSKDIDRERDSLPPVSPTSQQQRWKESFIKGSILLSSSLGAMVAHANAQESIDINKEEYRKALFSQPSDDFWYPPFTIGRWNTTLSFTGAKFSDQISLEEASKDNNVPGFSKYSVIFASNMGKDISNLTLRYAQVDSHPREDHPFNIRNLVPAFLPNTKIISAPYSWQKAPDWFHSPANNWQIKYADEAAGEEGTVDLFTRKRNIKVFAGTVETIEFFRQTLTKTITSSSGEKKQQHPIVGDYAMNWKLSAPASIRDEFIKVSELSSTQVLEGALSIFVYPQPTNDLYLKLGAGKPAGVFSYNVTMQRLNATGGRGGGGGADNGEGGGGSETAATTYPFVWRDDGPVELDQYFGY